MPAKPVDRRRAAVIACALAGALAVTATAPAGAQDPTSSYTAPEPTSPYTAPAPVPVPATQPAPSSCANAAVQPTAVAAAAYGEAIRCLVNVDRRTAGLRPLRTNRQLRIAAVRHTTDMVARRYFEHVGPRGDTLVDRVKPTGYTRARAWKLGEVLAWGTGDRATPAGVVAAWMASPPHHAILMDPSLRDLGVGLVRQVAPTGAAGVTVTGDLGRRS